MSVHIQTRPGQVPDGGQVPPEVGGQALHQDIRPQALQRPDLQGDRVLSRTPRNRSSTARQPLLQHISDCQLHFEFPLTPHQARPDNAGQAHLRHNRAGSESYRARKVLCATIRDVVPVHGRQHDVADAPLRYSLRVTSISGTQSTS